MRSALIVIDVQKDLCPGGALPIAGADEVIEPANILVRHFHARGYPVVFTRDWHPPNHGSFRAHGGSWPAHCIADSAGAAFHEDLYVPGNAVIIAKGAAPDLIGHSGFEATTLGELLDEQHVAGVVVVGLSTDYHVKSTVLDALAHGLEVTVLTGGVRAVNLEPGDGERAIAEMRRHGARFAPLADIAPDKE